jgi:archaellum biogenesis protein FlaJ (TadC family)
MPVNYARIALATLGATVAYFAYGFAMFAALPSMKNEFMKYPNVYRSHDSMMKVMPYGMFAILISIVVVAVLYAKLYPAGGGIVSGAYLGALIGIFSVCTFVIHNYVNLNIGLALTLYQGIIYFIQWVIVGAAIGLIYKPS